MSNNCSKCKHWVFRYNQTDEHDIKFNTRGDCCIRSVCNDNFPERDMDECCDEFEAEADGWPTPIGWWESVNLSRVATPAGHDPVFYHGVKAAEAGARAGDFFKQLHRTQTRHEKTIKNLKDAISRIVVRHLDRLDEKVDSLQKQIDCAKLE